MCVSFFLQPSGGARNWFPGDNSRGGLKFDKKARDDRNPISPSFFRALGTKKIVLSSSRFQNRVDPYLGQSSISFSFRTFHEREEF